MMSKEALGFMDGYGLKCWKYDSVCFPFAMVLRD